MLFKNTLKKVKKSFGRFFSLMFIILLGVGFYTGIRMSIPNIKTTQNEYYDDTKLMDLKMLSSVGFDDDDINYISNIEGVKSAYGSYSKEVLVNENVVKIHAIIDDINGFSLKNGRMPNSNNECLADERFYKVGDEIDVSEEYRDNLKESHFKVVGTIDSPLYSTSDYGSANIGNGKIYSFIFVPKEVFDYSAYTESYLLIDKDESDVPYSDSYEEKIENTKENIENASSKRIDEKIKSIIHDAYGDIDLSLIDVSLLPKIEWYVQDRKDVIPTYAILDSQYSQVVTLANIIPLFFVLIVILMTSNTMKRMVVEERGEMGTLSSLGVTNGRIILNYLLYVLTATLIGSILGYFLGTIFLPGLVHGCFNVIFPDIKYRFDLILFLECILVSCALMSFVTIRACRKELRQKPADLLRPVSPKSGKVVLLERISFLWKRLSFSSKITARNISRYKKRVFMTLIGTAGCTFLILIGFAIKDSINTIGDKQYGELFKYENFIVLNGEVDALNDDLKNEFEGLITDPLLINQSSYKVSTNDENDLDVYMIVPSEEDKFYDYFTLRDLDGNALTLDDKGVVITPKIAERTNASVGDEITVKSSSNKEYKLKVEGITENYVSNYIYIDKKLYEEIFGSSAKYNIVVSKNESDKDDVVTELLKYDDILSISFSNDLLKTANEYVGGLNNIVVLLVIISSFLAFTVLYNLTSININERTREIATLKVLGFRDNEANAYIYRETLVTVIFGIMIGLIITPFVHAKLMELLETDTTVFLTTIKVQSYFYAALLTLTFAIIMQVVTYFKLKKIDMIESLKAVE